MLHRLLDPFLILMLGVGVVTALLWLKRKIAPRLIGSLAGAYLLLYIGCTPVAMYFALGSLEWQFDYRQPIPADPQAIVVLGGYLVYDIDNPHKPTLGDDTLHRCLGALELYRNGPPRPLVVCGGMRPISGAPTLAEAMADFLRTHGLDSAEIVIEDQSWNTHQNAVKSAQLLNSRNIDQVVLVTDAFHMPRAERCFQAEGLKVTPFGVQQRTDRFTLSIWSFLPSLSAAQDLNRVAHEWLGIAWYWMRGFI